MPCTPSLPTNIVDLRGFDSSIILILRGGILMSIVHFPKSLSQAMLVGGNVSREIGHKVLIGQGKRRMTFEAPPEPFMLLIKQHLTPHEPLTQCVLLNPRSLGHGAYSPLEGRCC